MARYPPSLGPLFLLGIGIVRCLGMSITIIFSVISRDVVGERQGITRGVNLQRFVRRAETGCVDASLLSVWSACSSYALYLVRPVRFSALQSATTKPAFHRSTSFTPVTRCFTCTRRIERLESFLPFPTFHVICDELTY